MTGGLVYRPADCEQSAGNPDFVRWEECSIEEEIDLRLVLRRHWELTGSPRAEALLNSEERLGFVRLQPVQLPCTVQETWSPILERLENSRQNPIELVAVTFRGGLDSSEASVIPSQGENVSLAEC